MIYRGRGKVKKTIFIFAVLPGVFLSSIIYEKINYPGGFMTAQNTHAGKPKHGTLFYVKKMLMLIIGALSPPGTSQGLPGGAWLPAPAAFARAWDPEGHRERLSLCPPGRPSAVSP